MGDPGGSGGSAAAAAALRDGVPGGAWAAAAALCASCAGGAWAAALRASSAGGWAACTAAGRGRGVVRGARDPVPFVAGFVEVAFAFDLPLPFAPALPAAFGLAPLDFFAEAVAFAVVVALAAPAAFGFLRAVAVAVRVAPLDAVVALVEARSARLELRRTGRVRGRLVMTSRSESSRSGTIRMMARALRHHGAIRETNRPPPRSFLRRRR